MATFTLSGHIAGEIYWSRVGAAKPVEMSWGTGEYDSLRQAAESLMRREDGDFADAPRLTADSLLIVDRHGRHGQSHRHVVEVRRLESIADYVAPDVYSSDFFGEEA